MLKKILIAIIFTAVMIELAFRLDPQGLLRYKDSMRRVPLYGDTLPKPMPGKYALPNGEITILDSSIRYTPDTSDASCKIAVVGDSITFGWETDDHSTWVNLLAVDNPMVHFENLGVPGYNVVQIESVIRNTDYDGYIYLYFENDDVVGMTVRNYQSLSAAITYLYSLVEKPEIAVISHDEVIEYLNKLPRNTFVFGFDMSKTKALSRDYPINIIPFYSQFISRVDWHPNDDGHQFIYEQIRGKIASFADTICNKVVVKID